MGRAVAHFVWTHPLGRGNKGQISMNFNSITKSVLKIFKPNFVCILTNEISITYQTGFSLHRLGHAPGEEHWGTRGCRLKIVFFYEIQPNVVCELLT